MNDAELLERFNDDRDEDAFRALLEKYLGLVFGAAMRRTQDYALAEEVSQIVFTLLAKKAPGLKAKPTLAPWLYGCTLIESAQALRRNRAYDKKMKAFCEELKTLPGRDVWSEVLPLLDEAIQRLPSDDRALILLRFFERKSFKEIASEVGKSAAAVQKRTERALEKLGCSLKRKGLAVPTSVMAFGVSTELAKAAPAGLGTAIAKGCLGGASAMTTKTLFLKAINLMINTKMKTTAALAVVAAITAGWQWAQNQYLRTELAKVTGLLENASGTPEEAAVIGESTNTSPMANRAVKDNSLRDWRQALYEPDPVVRVSRIGGLLEALNPTEALAVAQLFEKVQRQGLQIADEYRLFMRSWGKQDAATALGYAMDQAGKVYATREHPTPEVIAALSGWASADPGAARAWVEKLPEEYKGDFVSGLIEGWSIADFQSAAAFAQHYTGGEENEGRARNDWISVLLQRSLSAGGIPAVQQWIANIPDDENTLVYKRQALDRAVRTMLESDPSAAADSISQSGNASYVTGDTLIYASEKLAQVSPAKAMSWVTSLTGAQPADIEKATGNVLRRWTLQDSQSAADWLRQIQSTSQYDAMTLIYAGTLALIDPVTASAWSKSISDPNVLKQAEFELTAASYARGDTASEPSASGLSENDAMLLQAQGRVSAAKAEMERQAALLSLRHE